MRLRTQLLLLVVAVALSPLLVAAIYAGASSVLRQRADVAQRDFPLAMRLMRDELPRFLAGEQETIDLPEGVALTVLDTENRVLFSSHKELAPGAAVDPRELLRASREETDTRTMLEPLFRDGTLSGTFLLSIPVRAIPALARPGWSSWPLRYGLVVLLPLAVIAAAGAWFIATGVNRSVTRLQRATRRIADGDLDFEMQARGTSELASLARSFDAMRGALKEETERRSRLLAAVSHDVKTPLTAIKGYLEAIADGLAEDPRDPRPVSGDHRRESRPARRARLGADRVRATVVEPLAHRAGADRAGHVIRRGRVVGSPLIATDGFEYYVGAIRGLFGSACVYGQVLKTRRNNRVVRVERRVKIGTATRLKAALWASEDSETLNTSFVERLNLTIRQGSAYLRRRSPCHARCEERLRGHVELLRCHYNFGRPHRAFEVRARDQDASDAGRGGQHATELERHLHGARSLSTLLCGGRAHSRDRPAQRTWHSRAADVLVAVRTTNGCLINSERHKHRPTGRPASFTTAAASPPATDDPPELV